MTLSSTQARYVFSALYAAAALILVDQLGELLVSLHPFHPEAVQWRFGAYGLVLGRTTTLLIADVTVVLAALGLGHPRVVQAWGVVHLVLGAVLLLGLMGFVLDAVQLRRELAARTPGGVVVQAARALVIGLLAVVYCIWAAWAAIRGRGGPGQAAPKDSLLVVGR